MRRKPVEGLESVTRLCIFRGCERAAGIAVFPRSTWEFFPSEPLTMPEAEAYISPLGAPPPSAMARL